MICFLFLEGKGKSQMAALIASPKNTSHRMSCILMEKLKILKRFLCVVSHFSLFYMTHFKNTKRKTTCRFSIKKIKEIKKEG